MRVTNRQRLIGQMEVVATQDLDALDTGCCEPPVIEFLRVEDVVKNTDAKEAAEGEAEMHSNPLQRKLQKVLKVEPGHVGGSLSEVGFALPSIITAIMAVLQSKGGHEINKGKIEGKKEGERY